MAKLKSPKPGDSGQRDWRAFIWYFIIGLIIISIATTFFSGPKGPETVDFSAFLKELDSGNIKAVTVRTSERVIEGETRAGQHFKSYYLEYPDFVSSLNKQGVEIKVNPTDSGWVWGMLLQAFLPFILIAALWVFIFRQAQGANNQALSFGKSRAQQWKKETTTVKTFKDVAGVDEAVEELQEIVEFLKHPQKYQAIGAKIPKGVLLMGPPGTGKTLLAKAVAGEADVPFFSLSGSDFVEMFVGVGASRVRDLFNQAKKAQPCIIFLDEIDAVGRHRGAGIGGGHDEREQTLNQLLVEMDGFEPNQTIIIIAATNRPDILDPALLRPGRFDRQVVVDKPDIKGRLDILNIHARDKKMEKDVDLEIVARGTPGFTGADLANLVNEGALLAARHGKKHVEMSDLNEATERVLAGPERKSRLISDKEKEIVAYHEVGHAIVAHTLPETDPVHKVTILPRGLALGYTLQLPVEDKHLVSKAEIENRIKILMGGRIAEDIVFHSITSGASNDIEKATELARNYVCTYGMNPKLGTRKYGKSDNTVFLGRDYSDHSKDYSEHTAHLIDEEIKALIEQCYHDAKSILTTHRDQLDLMSKLLMKKEVLEGEVFIRLLENPAQAQVELDAEIAKAQTDKAKAAAILAAEASKKQEKPVDSTESVGA
jgi:cell division protease FtsH